MTLVCSLPACDDTGDATGTGSPGTTSGTDTDTPTDTDATTTSTTALPTDTDSATDTDGPPVPAVCDEAHDVEVQCGTIQGGCEGGDTDGDSGGSSSGGIEGECPDAEAVRQCVLDAITAEQSFGYEVQETPGHKTDYTDVYRATTDGRVWWRSSGPNDFCFDSESGVRQGNVFACEDWACVSAETESASSIAMCSNESDCDKDGV